MNTQQSLLELGDVIEADESWRITDLSEDSTTLTIDQNKTHDNDTGEIHVNLHGPAVNNLTYGERGITLADRVEQAGISLRGLKFLVIDTNMQGGGPAPHGEPVPYPNGHHVTAQLLDENHELVPGGLKVEFYQSGCFNCMVERPNVVGRRAVEFAPFVPA